MGSNSTISVEVGRATVVEVVDVGIVLVAADEVDDVAVASRPDSMSPLNAFSSLNSSDSASYFFCWSTLSSHPALFPIEVKPENFFVTRMGSQFNCWETKERREVEGGRVSTPSV